MITGLAFVFGSVVGALITVFYYEWQEHKRDVAAWHKWNDEKEEQ